MEESFPSMLETLGLIPAASKRKIGQISLLEYKSLFYISWLLYKKTVVVELAELLRWNPEFHKPHLVLQIEFVLFMLFITFESKNKTSLGDVKQLQNIQIGSLLSR